MKFTAALVVALLALSSAQAEVLSLITGPTSGSVSADSSVGTVIYSLTDLQPTGTGVIDPFLRIEANSGVNGNPTEGYNTDFRLKGNKTQFNEKQDHTYTHSLLLEDLKIITMGGTDYYKLLLDSNQIGASTGERISLAELQLYTGSSNVLFDMDPAAHTFGSGGTAQFVYSLDVTTTVNRVDLPVQGGNSFGANDNPGGNGSGSGDMFVFVPVQLFAGKTAGHPYFYLYSRFGNTDAFNAGDPNGTGFEQNDGFEEWAATLGANDTQQVVPEPSSLALVAVGLAGLSITGLRRIRRQMKHAV